MMKKMQPSVGINAAACRWWMYEFWNPPPKKVAGVFYVQGVPADTEQVWINAPVVPEPARLGEDFDQGSGPFGGGRSGDPEQAADFGIYARHYVPEMVSDLSEKVAARLKKMRFQP